jgi:hypothetical protein
MVNNAVIRSFIISEPIVYYCSELCLALILHQTNLAIEVYLHDLCELLGTSYTSCGNLYCCSSNSEPEQLSFRSNKLLLGS